MPFFLESLPHLFLAFPHSNLPFRDSNSFSNLDSESRAQRQGKEAIFLESTNVPRPGELPSSALTFLIRYPLGFCPIAKEAFQHSRFTRLLSLPPSNDPALVFVLTKGLHWLLPPSLRNANKGKTNPHQTEREIDGFSRNFRHLIPRHPDLKPGNFQTSKTKPPANYFPVAAYCS